MKKLSIYYKNIAIIFTNTVLLFSLLNIIAWFFVKPTNYSEYIIHNRIMLKENPKLMQDIYEGRPIEEIKQIQDLTPNIKSHPVLEFMNTPSSNKIYQVGFENCRLDSFITPANFWKLINGSTWLLGGSTAFGYSVSSNENLTYFLNKNKNNDRYLNFGVPSYQQKLEIEKLILLLQKGYRPKRVIFLDGLNDITQLLSNPFEANETPAKPINAYTKDIGLYNVNLNKNLLYALPIVRLWYSYKASMEAKKKQTAKLVHESIYNENALYNKHPYLHQKIVEKLPFVLDSSILKKTDQYYQSNIDLIDALSKAWHFEYKIFYQPIGPLLETNHFIANKKIFKKEFPLYHGWEAIHQHVKKRIKEGRYKNFYDISETDKLTQYPYVDLTHYSPSLNRLLAERIKTELTRKAENEGKTNLEHLQ